MNSREVFPDEELRRRIMDFIMAAGQTLLENGAEVFRVEQTMEIMARSFHLREFHVYVLTNGIFASAGTAEISEVRNVPTRTTHLGRVAAVNALSREIAEGNMTLDEAESRLVLARRIPFPKDWVQLVSGMCGAFCFALIFGGTLRSALAAALAGFLASGYLLLCESTPQKVSKLLQLAAGFAGQEDALLAEYFTRFTAYFPREYGMGE